MIVVSSRFVVLSALALAAACNLPLFGAKRVTAPPRPVASPVAVKRAGDATLLTTRGAKGAVGIAVQLWGAPGALCPGGAWRRRIGGQWVCHADFLDDDEARRALIRWRDAWSKGQGEGTSSPAPHGVDSRWTDVFGQRRSQSPPALMVVVGDARAETLEVARGVSKHLTGRPAELSIFSEAREGPRVRLVAGTPALELLLPLPPMADGDAPALELLARILASRSYSGAARLEVRLHWRRGGGLLQLRCPSPGGGAGRGTEAVSTLIRFVSRLAESGPTAVELARARASIEAERGRQLQSPHGRARRLALYYRRGGSVAFEDLFAQGVRRVTPKLAREVARRLLRPANYFLRASSAGAPGLTEAAARRALAAYAQRAAPIIRETGGSATTAKLPGGARVRVEVDESAPWVALRIAWRAGGSLEAHNEAGISRLIAATLTREARRRHGDELRAAGGALDAVAGLDFFGLRAAGPAHQWERLLELLADMALRGPTDKVSFRDARRELLGRALTVEADPRARLGQIFARQVFGAHPYALPAEGYSSALSRIGLPRLRRYHRAKHSPRLLMLSVVGKVDAARLVAKAARLFGGADAAGPTSPLVPAPLPTWQSTMHVESSASARRVHLALGYPAPARGRPDDVLFQILARVLRHRAQRNPAIAPFSLDLRIVGGILGGALFLRVGVPAEKAQAVLTALSKEVEGLRAGIPVEALVRAKRETLRRLRRTLQGQAGRAALHAMNELVRAPGERGSAMRKMIKQVDATRLRVVANRYLRSEARVIVALQPAKLSPGAELRLEGRPGDDSPASGRSNSKRGGR